VKRLCRYFFLSVTILALSACSAAPNNATMDSDTSAESGWDSRSGQEWPNSSWAALVSDWVEACGTEPLYRVCNELMFNPDLCFQVISYEEGCGADSADIHTDGQNELGYLSCDQSASSCSVSVKFLHNNFHRAVPYGSLRAVLYAENEVINAQSEAIWDSTKVDDPYVVASFDFTDVVDVDKLLLLVLIPGPSDDESVNFAGIQVCKKPGKQNVIIYSNCLRLEGYFYKNGQFLPN